MYEYNEPFQLQIIKKEKKNVKDLIIYDCVNVTIIVLQFSPLKYWTPHALPRRNRFRLMHNICDSEIKMHAHQICISSKM